MKLPILQNDRRYEVEVIYPTHVPFENSLHHCVNWFMNGKYDFWLTMDNDNPPGRNPLDLAVLDKDVMGLPTPVWHWTGEEGERPIYWNAYKYNKSADAYNEWPVREGLQCVDAVGTGCVLISRRVFEASAMRAGAFARKLNEDGTVDRGNDISFCERARDCDFEIWANYDYPAEHMVEVPLNECSRAFKALMAGE
jgi:hypothetical protein